MSVVSIGVWNGSIVFVVSSIISFSNHRPPVTGANCEIQKPSTCCATLSRCKFWVDVSRFSPSVIYLSRKKTTFCGLKKVVAKSRVQVYFEQQIWLCCSFFIKPTTCHATNAAILDPHQTNQPISALHFFNPQQMFLLRDKLITLGEKRETSTQNLLRNTVARRVEGFCISYFAALSHRRLVEAGPFS